MGEEGSVCWLLACRYSIPYLSLRALSDLIDGDANEDFNAFCKQVMASKRDGQEWWTG